MTLNTIKTRILILSDTHDLAFPKPSTPFSHPPPRAIDLLIHCGDLTRAKHQTRNAYTGALALLAAIPAKLKLVIAGNHDIALDPMEWANRDGNPTFAKEAMEIMIGPKAREDNLVFLDEGMHEFVLANGAKVKVYATPYTPFYSHSAFKYPPNEDRFNATEHIPAYLASLKNPIVASGENPIPSWPDVDILITHGPPEGVLDLTRQGKLAGCPNLRRALERCRPRVHCFGHLHEGYGGVIFNHGDGRLKPLCRGPGFEFEESEAGQDGKGKKSGMAKKKKTGDQVKKDLRDVKVNPYPELANLVREVVFGESTIMVNAAIRERGFGGMWEDCKLPWVLEVDLPAAEPCVGEVGKPVD